MSTSQLLSSAQFMDASVLSVTEDGWDCGTSYQGGDQMVQVF